MLYRAAATLFVISLLFLSPIHASTTSAASRATNASWQSSTVRVASATVIHPQTRSARQINIRPRLSPSSPDHVIIAYVNDSSYGPNGARCVNSCGVTFVYNTADNPTAFGLTVNGVSAGNLCLQCSNGTCSAAHLLNPYGAPHDCGAAVVQAFETASSGTTYYSPPISVTFCDNGNFADVRAPRPEPKCCLAFAGGPVDMMTGELTYDYTDVALSGPFGLQFVRWYRSLSTYGSPPVPADMGNSWFHSYSAFLDTTNLASGGVNFYDERGYHVYFGGVATGATSYDQLSGDSLLAVADGTFQVTTWHGKVYLFDSAGRLKQMIDRVGNTQTITRDGSQRIASVADTLGRSLLFTYDSSNRIKTVTSSPSGVSLIFTYDSGTNCGTGDLCSAQESDGKIWTYQYQDLGPNPGDQHNLTRVTDPLGHIVEQTAFGQVLQFGNYCCISVPTSQSTDGGQNTLTFSYAFSNNGPKAWLHTTVTDGLNRATVYYSDSIRFVLISVTGTMSGGGNQSVTYNYDPYFRLISRADGNSHTTTYGYGRDTIASGLGYSYIIQAVPGPNSITEQLASGLNRVTSISYYPLSDPRQDLPNIISIPSVDTPGNTETITDTFGTNGLLTSQATQGYIAGSATTYTTGFSFDTKGRLQQITGPRTDLVQHTTFAYYPDTDSDMARRGQLQTITDALSHVTTFAGDAAPNNTYNLFGGPLSITDPNGVARDLSYDARGRTLASTTKGVTGDPTPLTTSYVFDAAGRLTSIKRPLLNGLSLTYDTSNRLTNVTRFTASTNLQSEQIVLGYDVMSQLTSQLAQACTTPAVSCVTWSTKRQESFQYDSYRRVKEIDHPVPSGSKILNGYDLAGNLSSVQDENHSTPNSTYNYDFANRLTSVVQTLVGAPGNQITTSFGYDLHDNLNSLIDPNSNQTTYAFDDFNRVRVQTSPVSGVSTYAYDPDDNLLTFADANGAMTTRSFDGLDRVLSAMSARSGFTTETVNWAYDDATSGNFGIGRLKSITDPSGSTIYTYDRRGLLKTETPTILGNVYSLAYAYDSNANRTGVTYPDSSVVNYTFDFADRPLSATLGSTTFVSSASYAPFGPLTSLSLGNAKTQTLSYDLRYRPTENKLCCGRHGASLADYTYAEDGVGNITGITDTVNTGFNRTFVYDDLNRLTTANSGPSLWNSGSYSYDSMGNMKTLALGSARTASFSYSGTLPKLTSVTENGTPRSISYDAVGNETGVGTATYGYGTRNLLESGDALSYTYDGWGRRLVTSGGSGARYSFFSPGMALLSESALTMSGRPAIAYKYVWFAGRPIAQVDGAGTHWTFSDHLGTPEIQTNSSGTITYLAEYEPYGKVFALRSGDVHQPLRLPGQVAEQLDTGANGATEKSFNMFRWYRAGWGRYSQADPIGLGGGVNPFEYVGARPILLVDRFGLWGLSGALYDVGGGALTVGFDRCQFFAISRIGLGLGSGVSFDPLGFAPNYGHDGGKDTAGNIESYVAIDAYSEGTGTYFMQGGTVGGNLGVAVGGPKGGPIAPTIDPTVLPHAWWSPVNPSASVFGGEYSSQTNFSWPPVTARAGYEATINGGLEFTEFSPNISRLFPTLDRVVPWWRNLFPQLGCC